MALMNTNKTVGIVVALVIVLVAGGALAYSQSNKASYQPAESASVPAPTEMKAYALADVASHSTQASCWTAIDGSVYDVTSWISAHPGGAAAILSLCGKDGSAAFTDQHGGERRPTNELAGFKIGTLSSTAK